MTDESENRMLQEITFVIEEPPWKDGPDGQVVAIRKGDREPDEEGRVPGGYFSGTGETPLEAIEACVKTLRANEER